MNKSLILVIFTFFVVTTTASAVDLPPAQESQAQALFGSLLSPFCPGRLISDCPSGKASELKDTIRGEIASGKTIETIRQELFSQFGEDTLRPVPKEEGFGLVGWLLPGLFFLVGVVILARWLRGMNTSHPLPSDASVDPALEARIRRDLEDL